MIRAVVFDAVGTLIVAEPSVAQVYSDIGRRHGSRYLSSQLHDRFEAAFAHQELIDRAAGWVTEERRELQRWRDIVATVLDDVTDPAECFRDLYEHFAQPASWVCVPGIGSLLAELGRRQLRTAIASNFDHRLPSIVRRLPEFAEIDRVYVSSTIGWRKPARGFFEAVRRGLDIAAREILFVGDDPTNDLHGATDAGMQAILFDRKVDDIGEIVRSRMNLRSSTTFP